MKLKPVLHVIMNDNAYQVLLTEKQLKQILRVVMRRKINVVKKVGAGYAASEEIVGHENEYIHLLPVEENA